MDKILYELTEKINPIHTAVLVVDLQNDFCAPEGYIGQKFGCDPQANESLAKHNVELTEVARKAGILIVWIQAIYDPEYLSAPMIMKGGQSDNEKRCLNGTWGAEFYNVEPKEEDLVIKKHRYSAFSGTSLDNHLRRRSIKTTVITGVSTNICVESTLREAFNLGYYVVIPRDCIAGNNKKLHDATLQNVEFLLGDVTESSSLIEHWSAFKTG